MSKIVILALLIAATMLTLPGCDSAIEPGETGDITSPPVETEDPGPGDRGTDDPGEEQGNGDIEEPAQAVDPFSYFGLAKYEIEQALGAPGSAGFYEGAEYYFYEEKGIAFFFWAGEGEESGVRSIMLTAGGEVAGITVGMTFDEIKAILGEPVSEGFSDHDETYSLVCDYNEFRLFFTAEEADGPTVSLQIKYLADS